MFDAYRRDLERIKGNKVLSRAYASLISNSVVNANVIGEVDPGFAGLAKGKNSDTESIELAPLEKPNPFRFLLQAFPTKTKSK